MDPAGLLTNILLGATNIDKGRKNLATKGFEPSGRILYEDGISLVLSIFKKAQDSLDPQTMILVEKTFLQQDLQFCDEADTVTRSSLTQAIQSFNDALRCLKTVEDSTLYKAVETAFPTNTAKYRYKGLPRDAVHYACGAHRTRLQNSLRTPGINMIEKAVLNQRIANTNKIKIAYTTKQKKSLNDTRDSLVMPTKMS